MPTTETDAALSQETCRDRLSRSRSGLLAGTDHALPIVVPVDIAVRDGRLLLTVHKAALASRLVGQVVALSVGKNAFRFCRGWRVTARGLLGPPEPGDPALPLERYELEGVTFVRSR